MLISDYGIFLNCMINYEDDNHTCVLLYMKLPRCRKPQRNSRFVHSWRLYKTLPQHLHGSLGCKDCCMYLLTYCY